MLTIDRERIYDPFNVAILQSSLESKVYSREVLGIIIGVVFNKLLFCIIKFCCYLLTCRLY